jgi:hypothetical protein
MRSTTRRSGETRDPDAWLQSVTLRRLHVHMLNEQTIEGTLATNAEDGLVLKAAVLHQAQQPSIPMAGDVFIPRERIAFIQDVPAPTTGGES